MKKILFAAVPVFAVAAAALPYYLGGKAQESLDAQHRVLAETFFVEVVSRDYQRGWFSSEETTVVRLKSGMLAKLDGQLPDNVKILFDKPITLKNHIKHGPFADGISPVRATVQTEFVYDAEVQKTLARFFGDKTPVSARNVIKLGGQGSFHIAVSPFDYEELSGIKLKWQGMNADFDYEKSFDTYTARYSLPGLSAQLADKGSLNAQDISIHTESRPGSHGITLGKSESRLGKFEVQWSGDIAYNIRLNDLVNMVTDLQIGAFINPNGSIPPSRISVENLAYSTQTDEAEQGFINSRGRFTFEKLHYGETQYGPLNIDIGAEHIHSESLAALKQRWQQIAAEKQPESQSDDLLLAAVRKEGAGLFTNNPKFHIHAFSFTAPSGHIKAGGQIALNGLAAADLNDAGAIVRKTSAELDFDISQTLLEEFAITQARSLFTVEDPTSEKEQQEISDTIRMLAADTINTMTAEGYLKKENGAVQTHFSLAENKIALNGKPFDIQSDEDAFAELEAQTAPEADSEAQPETATASAP